MKTPYYLIDEAALTGNLSTLRQLSLVSSVRVLLAQKAFSMYSLYPLIGEYLAGTAASGAYEARLGFEQMPGHESHVYSAAYSDDEFTESLRYSDHIIFNSIPQLHRYGQAARDAGKSVGLRINPECSTQAVAIYDPCAEYSRLGVTERALRDIDEADLALVDGFHFHTLCEQGSEDLEQTVAAVEDRFGSYLPALSFLNLGGGELITAADYDLPRLTRILRHLHDAYPNLTLYLEPGEAVAYRAGTLITTILDIVHNGIDIAILDAAAPCHTPDVIEMPYTPPVTGATALTGNELHEALYRISGSEGLLGSGGFDGSNSPAGSDSSLTGVTGGGHLYRLAGRSCLAGDVFGDYIFPKKLSTGDQIVFEDMAIYSFVKNNTFNGIPLPSLALRHTDGRIETVREFGYEDFRGRL